MRNRGPQVRQKWYDGPYDEEQMSLPDLAYNAYASSDLFSDIQFAAEDEIRSRGYSCDELYNYVTWGDN